MRIALGVEYDGAHFEGWQTQPHRRTVQDALEAALSRFADAGIETTCAGRTDAGVHATGQVVHFDTDRDREMVSWVRGVNRYLPSQVAVQWAQRVDESFHARFSARARHYEYWICNRAARSPLWNGRAGWVFRPLDLAAMQAAAACWLGRQDFSSFRSSECQAKSPVRTLHRLDVERPEDGLIRIRACADGFLHHMVRNLVGALVEVGTGRKDPAWATALLAARDRRRGAPTFDAAGLYLTAVDYDADCGLPHGSAPMIGRHPDSVPRVGGPARGTGNPPSTETWETD